MKYRISKALATRAGYLSGIVFSDNVPEDHSRPT